MGTARDRIWCGFMVRYFRNFFSKYLFSSNKSQAGYGSESRSSIYPPCGVLVILPLRRNATAGI